MDFDKDASQVTKQCMNSTTNNFINLAKIAELE